MLNRAEIGAELRRVHDAYSRCDFDAAAMERVHPEIELVPAGGQPAIRGAAAFRAWMEPDAFESQVVEVLDFRTAGNKLRIRQLSKLRGGGSGIDAEFLTWSVWTLDEHGRTTPIEIYLDHQEAEALESAGLSE